MKKFFAMVLVIVVICTMLSATALACQLDRCPLCGAENTMMWYGKDLGYCYKCHRSTDTTLLKMTIKSNSADPVEIAIFNSGKLERLSYTTGGSQELWFAGMQHGLYTVAITEKGHATTYHLIYLYSQEQRAAFKSSWTA